MPKNYEQFTAADWRQVLKVNQRKTVAVIGAFIIIYLLIGLLLDLYIYSSMYRQATLQQIFFAIIKGQLRPTFMLVTGVIAIIAILISFKFHDRIMLLGTEAREIKVDGTNSIDEQQLLNVVEELKVAAGMRYCPRVFIIEEDYMNAFASGYSEKSSLVAITRGLLNKLKRDELQAVMAHELSHIRHGDIKLTLLASVLANLMLIMVDVLFYSALFSNRGNSRDGESRGNLFFIIILLRYLLPLVTMFLLLFLSRKREYMADAGSVQLTRDPDAMARALLVIQNDYKAKAESSGEGKVKPEAHESLRHQAYIFDPVSAGFMKSGSTSDILSTHPSIKNRLRALGFRMNDEN
jgi:heat shock protein HtpX